MCPLILFIFCANYFAINILYDKGQDMDIILILLGCVGIGYLSYRYIYLDIQQPKVKPSDPVYQPKVPAESTEPTPAPLKNVNVVDNVNRISLTDVPALLSAKNSEQPAGTAAATVTKTKTRSRAKKAPDTPLLGTVAKTSSDVSLTPPSADVKPVKKSRTRK